MIKEFLICLYGCNGIKGIIFNFEDFLLNTNISFLVKLSNKFSTQNKLKRLRLIESVNEPLISIILPVYNSEKTIIGAIESIIKQTYKKWELIVIDDGSEDKTNLKIQEFVSNENRIKIIKNKKNKGVSYSRNIGLMHAKGEYITFHDADDRSHFERLEYQLFSFLKNPSHKVVIFQYIRENLKREPYLINRRKSWNRVSGMMIEKETFKKIGFFKPITISEDSEYYERILAVYGKSSRKVICKTLYYALFIPDSLLFSNAKYEVNGMKINYKINNNDQLVLDNLRSEHKLIVAGTISPYQNFIPDPSI